MKAKTRSSRNKGKLARNGDARLLPFSRVPDNIRAPSYRINMLDAENFTVALLGEFGFYQGTIAKAMNLSCSQVSRRLRFAQVDPRTYRRGESVIGQMILRGVHQSGVRELRHFAEATLSTQLQQLGWLAGKETPVIEVPLSKAHEPSAAT